MKDYFLKLKIGSKIVFVGLGLSVLFAAVNWFVDRVIHDVFLNRSNLHVHFLNTSVDSMFINILANILLTGIIIFAAMAAGNRLIKKHLFSKEEADSVKKYLDVAGSMIVVIGRDQKVLLVNRKASEVLGFPESEIVDKYWFHNFLPVNIRERVRNVFEQIMKGDLKPVEYFENEVVNANRENRMIAWHNAYLRNNDGEIVATISSGQDITEKKVIDDVMKQLALGFPTETKEGFMRAAAKYLARVTGMEYAVIGKIDNNNRDAVVTMAVCFQDKIMENLNYDLKNAPYANVIRNGYLCYPKGARSLFPEDRLLGDMQAESFAGAPLLDLKGRPSGILLAVGRSGIENTDRIQSLMQIFAMRISYELEHTNYENALVEEREKFKELYDNSPVGYYSEDINGMITEINQTLLEWLGYEREELINKAVDIEILSTKSRADLMELIDKMRKSAEYDEREVDMRRKDGTFFPAILQALAMHDRHGKFTSIRCSVTDITERKKTERQLEDSEKRYRTLVESADDAIVLTDLSGKRLFMNKAYHANLGYDPSEIVAGWKEIVHPDDVKDVDEKIKELMNKGVMTGEYRVKHKNGNYINRWAKAVLIYDSCGKPEAILSILRDVSEIRQARKTAKAYEDIAHNVVNSMPLGIHLYRLENGKLIFTGANLAAERILGIKHEPLIGKEVEDAFPGLKGTQTPAHYIQVAETGKPWYMEQVEYKEGRISGVFEVNAFRTSEGSIAVVFEDITERRRAQEEIKNNEELFRMIFEQAGTAVALSVPNHRFVRANQAFCGMFGYTQEELQKMTFRDITHENSIPADSAGLDRLIKGLADEYSADKTYVRKDGSSFKGHVTVRLIRDRKGAPLYFMPIVTQIANSEKKKSK